MPKGILRAEFEPSEASLLTNTPTSTLLAEFPILASALSNIFPYLLLMDNFLEIITWTNDDPYQNFLLVVIYSTVVMYWHLVSLLVLPLLMALTFSVLVWSISSVINDTKYNEKPTIDEVLHSLHNITVRFELLLRPIQHFPVSKKNILTALTSTAIVTPIHVFLVRTFLNPQRYLWISGVFVLTYHSPWSFSVRRLLWRSVYIRIIAFYITGLDIKLDRRNQNHHLPVSRIHSPTTSDVEDGGNSIHSSKYVQLLSDFKILKKVVVSPTQLRQIVLFEILENERRWLGLGWAKLLLPSERPNFCYQQSMMSSPHVLDASSEVSDAFPFPVFDIDLYTYLWDWLDDRWTVDSEYNKGKDPEGWIYYDNNWGTPAFVDGITKYTRSRKWVRKAVLIIDKRDSVQDE